LLDSLLQEKFLEGNMADNSTTTSGFEELRRQIASLQASLSETQDGLETSKTNADQFFLIVIAIIIFFMQGGFAFLEAGSVRSKNTVNILIKNILDAFIGGVSYWAIGWGLAYGAGGNPFCGGSQFFNYQLDYNLYPKWFFQFVFAATAATIVSGAIAERCQFGAYFTYSILLTAWVYPPVSHWAWDGGDENGVGMGWLAAHGYKDFAGSGVVHLLGATCALVGCYFIGRRRGRFNKKGEILEMAGHSVPLAGLGGFILIFGFLAFNGGSQASISQPGDGDIVALAIVNTILCACCGGLTVLFFNKMILKQPWSFLMTLNGALTGMVAACAGCNLYEPWGAIIVGIGAGFCFIGIHFTMIKFRLDDPLDAVAVHGGGGLFGLLCVPFLMYANQEVGERGILWDGHLAYPWQVLGFNILGAVCIMAWSAFWSLLIFGGLYMMEWLRIDVDLEIKGMDIVKHGEAAYPAQAWVEYQYNVPDPVADPGTGRKESVPQHFKGTGLKFGSNGITADSDVAHHNNPMEMMPTTGALFSGVTSSMASKNLELFDEKKDEEKGQVNPSFTYTSVDE